jgi:hypothetical protein
MLLPNGPRSRTPRPESWFTSPVPPHPKVKRFLDGP